MVSGVENMKHQQSTIDDSGAVDLSYHAYDPSSEPSYDPGPSTVPGCDKRAEHTPTMPEKLSYDTELAIKINTRINKLEKKIDDLEKEKKEAETSYENKIRTLEHEIEDLKESKADVEKKLEMSTDENKTLKQEKEEKEKEILKKDNELLETKLMFEKKENIYKDQLREAERERDDERVKLERRMRCEAEEKVQKLLEEVQKLKVAHNITD